MADHYYIVTRPDCIWCDRAKALITQHLGTYTEFVYWPTESSSWSKFFMKTHGLKTVPQIFDSQYDLIGGYDSLKHYLNGYDNYN